MDEYFAQKYAGAATASARPSAAQSEEKKEEVPVPENNSNADAEAEAVETPVEGNDMVKESTEEEFAGAATKISAAFRGKKAREEVAIKREEHEASKRLSENPSGAEVALDQSEGKE